VVKRSRVTHESRLLIDGVPFSGYKQSGIGRQCGIEGLETFTETKTVGWPAG
jgi:acyl-CoA reductase-like NAD-dependent aldehyde dehydrogenase